jgi:hypothetical protein
MSLSPQSSPQRTAPGYDGVAIASFVTALCGLGVIPVVLGHVALGRIRRTGAEGTAFAVIGLVLGYAAIALGIVFFLIVGAAIWWGVSR